MTYFHELTEDDFNQLLLTKITWGELEERFPQPVWCTYPEAVRGMMGCWSLVDHMVTGEDYCKACDCYKAASTNKCQEGMV